MWPFKKRVPPRTLKFKTTPEETIKLCQLQDTWDAAKIIWGSDKALLRILDPIPRHEGPEVCELRYNMELAQLCRLRITKDEELSGVPWPDTFSRSYERKGCHFHFTVEGNA